MSLKELEKKFDLWFFRGLYLERNIMNELERTALNEVLRTVIYIAEKLDELDSKISQSEEMEWN